MQTNNPVLSRYEKADAPGFAYDEGRSAYTQASGQAPTATPAAPSAQPTATPDASGTPLTSTDAEFQAVTAGGGVRVTLNDVVVKSAIMFGLVVLFAFIGWNVITAAPGLMFPIFIVAIVLGFVNALKKKSSRRALSRAGSSPRRRSSSSLSREGVSSVNGPPYSFSFSRTDS